MNTVAKVAEIPNQSDNDAFGYVEYTNKTKYIDISHGDKKSSFIPGHPSNKNNNIYISLILLMILLLLSLLIVIIYYSIKIVSTISKIQTNNFNNKVRR